MGARPSLSRCPGCSIHYAPVQHPFLPLLPPLVLQLAPRADRSTFFLQNMWFVSNKENESNVIHTHPNALLSGVFCEELPLTEQIV